MWVLWMLLGRSIYSNLELGGSVLHREDREWSQKIRKNKGSQLYAQSAHCAHTGHAKLKCGFSGRSYSGPTIHIWPKGARLCTERVVNGLKKSAKNREANGMLSLPTGPTQVTKTRIVGSVDVFSSAYLFTFGPRGQGIALRGS